MKNNVHIVKSAEVNSDKTSISKAIKQFSRAALKFFTVEPFLLCYLLPSVISSLAVQKLNLEKACRADLYHGEDFCSRMVEGNIEEDELDGAAAKVQKLVADMTAWKQPLQSGIPALMILFVGAWSDRTGNRKALMLVPILGELVSSIGLVLSTYFFLEWPLWVTGLIEALPSAVTGGLSIALMGSYSYIADVTTIEERTFRIGVVAVIVTLGIPLGSSVSGVLTQAVGYYGIFGINLVFYAFGFMHTFFRIHDVRNSNDDVKKPLMQRVIEFFHLRNAWDTLYILFKKNGRNRRLQIWLVIWAHIVIVGPVFGEAPIMFLYTLKRYGMNVVDFSIFSTYSVSMGLVESPQVRTSALPTSWKEIGYPIERDLTVRVEYGTMVAVAVFSRWLKMHDALIGIIATASKVLSSFVYAFASTRDWFYSGPAFDFFGNTGVTAIRSLGTKVVDPDEVGKMCSLIGFVEAIVPVVYAPVYSKVYSNTLEIFPGAFYVLGGVMTVPAFFIFIISYIIHRKQQMDAVKDPKSKEFYARENEVTAL
ncbi:Solute carrier family 46 member 3 [Eumeta japonica]|uniref:Solute carrier family 46 member 3 n=1 Tax=Eumeta variegata TaxID=151549 RepID=A0A4C1T5F2_EUMVA|nr:Solute carrier family 46 member 3 [Eumeta japonica]